MKASKYLLALALCLASVCHAANITGKVVAVKDGDTITVLDENRVQHEVRLAGIDAPEKRQAFGQRSKQSLSELVFGQVVTVITKKKDRYGREVGKVLLGQNDVNLEQVRRGMAWFYRQYAKELTTTDRALYNEAEDSARSIRLGLWEESSPVPPWDFRKQTLATKTKDYK